MRQGRAITVSLGLLALAAAAYSGALPNTWRAWRYSRQVVVPSEPLVKVAIPAGLYARTENRLADLRLINDQGEETPFLIADENFQPAAKSLPVKLLENSFVKGEHTQIILDLRGASSFHDAVEIETPEPEFIFWVEVAASDDARTWRIVKERAPISRFRSEEIAGSRRIRYSPNNAGFLRLRILAPEEKFPVTSAAVYFSPEYPETVWQTIPVALTAASGPAHTSVWEADLSSTRAPVSGIVLETSQPEFFRVVHIQTSEDGKLWETRCTGQIYRYRAGEKQEESPRFFFGEMWASRFLRVEVVNRSDAPLTDARLALLLNPRNIVFRPQAGSSYRLLYGNQRAAAPDYDLARTLHLSEQKNLALGSLGPEGPTENYADPRPFTERHPSAVWVALGVAILLLGMGAMRALRSAQRP